MLRRRFRQLAWCSLALILIALSAWAAHDVALNAALSQLRDLAQNRLEVLAARLDGELERFDYLPSLLETSPDVFALLDAPHDPLRQQATNRYLRAITATAGADNLYVTDRSGLTLAAADWDRPGTPLGTDLSFRPYVLDAVAHGRGRFFGVGFTSRRAGYYLSYALKSEGVVKGVATVKVSLDAMEHNWSQSPGKVLVLDARGVVILASEARWKLHPVAPLSADMLSQAAASHTYGNAGLGPLEWHERGQLDAHAGLVRLDTVNYLASAREVNHGLWRLMILDNEAPALAAARNAAIRAALVCAVLLLLTLVAIQQWRAARQKRLARQALQAAHDSLEAKVHERTVELQALQHDLVHAGKLAALGQMSAGVVHEINQPLAALRTLSDNAVVLLQKGRLDEARDNLGRIASLTDRLGRMSQQLKAFAHKSQAPLQNLALQQLLSHALVVVNARVREHNIELSVVIEPPELCVMAEAVRLEQVLGNLMGNAIDALSDAMPRRLDVRAVQRGDLAVISVRDSGPGIAPEVLRRLFEPFVTTKPAGKGLGLGLVISAQVIREFGGRLSAGNLPAGGAEFVIELPLATQQAGTTA